MALEQLANLAVSSLSAGINNSTTSVAVTDGSKFSSTGNFRIQVDSEIMKVTANSSNTFTVARGQEGTTAASHSSGATVYQVITKESLDQWMADRRMYDTFANLPSAGVAGKFYIPTDGVQFAIDDGSNWNHYGPMDIGLTPPVDANFSWVNQGGATVVTTKGGVYLTAPAGSGQNVRGRYVAKSAPYKVTMYFVPFLGYTSSPSCGMAFYNSTSGKLMRMHLVNSSNNHYIEITKDTNTTTNSSQAALIDADASGNRINWFQLEDDNTNIYFRYSPNGKQWITAFSEARGTFFSGGNTPSGVMIVANSQNSASLDASIHVLHWLEQ